MRANKIDFDMIKKVLDNQVTHEENNFVIRNDEFDITAWEQTRQI